MLLSLSICHSLLSTLILQAHAIAKPTAADIAAASKSSSLADAVKGAMLGSIRTSWEQGTALGGIIETDDPQYSVFGSSPFSNSGKTPTNSLRLAISAAVRQTSDGRLSQNINDGLDKAALDGASSGSGVLLGSFTGGSRSAYFKTAATAQLNYLKTVKKTKAGAISMRADTLQYWADGVYMAPPFLAYYGAVVRDQSLLQLAYDNCRLYRNALLVSAPTGKLWAHIYDDTNSKFSDKGVWATGNAWAALGMLRVAVTIQKSSYANNMTNQTNSLVLWTKEILDGTFATINSQGLIPDYIQGGVTFGDATASAGLASAAYRAAVAFPATFGQNYTDKAGIIRDAVMNGIDSLGLLTPVVDPLSWSKLGIVSTEGQAFGLFMFAALRDFVATGYSVNSSSKVATRANHRRHLLSLEKGKIH